MRGKGTIRQPTAHEAAAHTLISLQSFHTDVLIADRAAGIVALERKSAFIEFARERFAGLNAGRFVVNEDYFSVDHDGHA